MAAVLRRASNPIPFEEVGLCLDEHIGLEELDVAASDFRACQ